MNRTRNDEVDVLRGAALFGICVVNVPFLAGIDVLVPPEDPADRLAAALVALLFQGKFFVLFSFLFGWGFAVQRESARKAGRAFGPIWGRRLACLLALGVAHASLVFTGDILVLYALLGALLWPLRDAAPRRLLGIGCALLCLAAFCLAALGLLLGGPLATALATAPAGAILPGAPVDAVADGAGYLGGFVDAARQRLAEWPFGFGFVLLFNGPLALAAFCTGLAAAKSDFFSPGAPAYRSFRHRWLWLLAVGLLLDAAYALAVIGALGDGVLALAAFSGLALGGPCLASVYLIAIVERVRRGGAMRSLAIAGRMSLTAYVTEGMIAGLLFNGYGFALYGSLGDLACLGIAVAVFALVLACCVAWSLSLPRGPLEWLLRTATRAGTSRSPRRAG